MTRKQRVAFDHLPKTAGTSISSALHAMIGETGELPQVSNMHATVMASAGNRRFVAGHMWFFPGEPLVADWYYCTLLRDPIDRFLSQFWFYCSIARSGAVHGLELLDPHVIAASRGDLMAYVTSPDSALRRSYTNVQAIHFAQRVHADPFSLDDEELLRCALESLEQYDLVGAFEDTQGFVDAIAADVGLPRAPVPRLNVTSERGRASETPTRVLELLRTANRVDLRLHEQAKERFQRAQRRTSGPPAEARIAGLAVSQEPAVVEFGTRQLEFVSVRCVGARSGTSSVDSGEVVQVLLDCNAREDADDVTFGIAVHDRAGHLIYGSNSRLIGTPRRVRAGIFAHTFLLNQRLGLGEYHVTVALHKGASHTEGCFHWFQNAAKFAVVGHLGAPFEGLVDLDLAIL